MSATDLWNAVVAAYDERGLISLTNIRSTAATTINTTAGENAAQGVIDLWPIFAQTDFDIDNATHVEVGKQATIAMLWRRGGSAANIAEVKWNEVFSDDGMIAKVRATGPRGHAAPSTNSGVVQPPEQTSDGRPYRGWSDRSNWPPVGLIPRRRPYDSETNF